MAAPYGCMMGNFEEAAIDFGWVCVEGLITEFECVTVSYGISCSFLVIITHECVIITKKLHEIPYDTVTHWNEVINPYLHRQLTCSFSTFSPTRATIWQWKRKCSRRGDFPRHIPSCLELNMQKILFYCWHSEKDSSKQIRFLCDYNFVGWCNFIINLYKQQQNIDSLSSKGWFIIISHRALLCLFLQTWQWARAACVFASQVSYYYAVCCRSIDWFYYAVDLWVKCSKFGRQRAGWEQGAGRVRCSYLTR